MRIWASLAEVTALARRGNVSETAVDIATMANSSNRYQSRFLIYLIHDAIIANANMSVPIPSTSMIGEGTDHSLTL
jgi:hypothetical protein